ncbi:uncharacterized protein LOC111253949 isoform X1 [Varroa destructor]|uniref:Uncharacterized protein n=2 Tax=Varroa destructor TaxID=109461 RepID=A0A7M7KPF6_VARDE|nr:uncharacterized protein LOC111253949 isoform X1 [Varroa destructor]XP_022669966.1 uncharacterized protein LOC111253949 isoform X1 [Varroa destructor]
MVDSSALGGVPTDNLRTTLTGNTTSISYQLQRLKMTGNVTVHEEAGLVPTSQQLLTGFAEEPNDSLYGESQITTYLDSFEKAVEYLEASETEFRAEVDALDQQIRNYNAELDRRAEALSLVQEKLAKRAEELGKFAKKLSNELHTYNEMIYSGESKLSRLLKDLEGVKQQQPD